MLRPSSPNSPRTPTTLEVGGSGTTAAENAETLANLRAQFNGTPIPVSFRELVEPVASSRSAHFLHPYPAKLLHHIPYFFLTNDSLSSPGSCVLDPFCGSGTVLLEAVLAGWATVGVDSNPLARLISTVKTTPIRTSKLRKSARSLLARAPSAPKAPLPDVVNLTEWFYPHVIRDLRQVSSAIGRVRSDTYRAFFQLCLSATARRLSRADPRVSVPVKLRPERYPEDHPQRKVAERRLRRLRVANVFKEFEKVVFSSIERLATLEPFLGSCHARVVGSDARAIRLPTNSSKRISLVITSPPYLSAQKYIRSSSLSLGWLSLAASRELPSLERRCLGREHFRRAEYQSIQDTGIAKADRFVDEIKRTNPLRACLVATFINEMRKALSCTTQLLEPGGHFVLVCAGNNVCGRPFPTHEILWTLLEDSGLEKELVLVDQIRSRGLMTKRHPTANVISQEHVALFRKPGRRGGSRG